MRGIIQRVKKAKVEVDKKTIGEINKGFLVFLGVHGEDTEKDLEYMERKILNLRVFEDENDKMNLSLKDVGGEILLVSQFTLYGDARKGNRPSFIESAHPDMAIEYYEKLIKRLRDNNIKVETGIFGADMDVSLINDGPVTIQLDSTKLY